MCPLLPLDDKDYDKLCTKLYELEAALNKPKKQPSFHAEEERRGRGAGMKSVLQALKPKPRGSSSSQSQQPAMVGALLYPAYLC